MKKQSIILQFEKPADAGMIRHFRAVIEPDDPITKCTIQSTFIPEHPATWSSITSGFSFCRAADTYDRETGMRLALKSALRNLKEEPLRARFWELYLAAHPVERRAQLAEIKKAEEQLGALLTHTAEKAWARMFSSPTLLEVPRMSISAQPQKANGKLSAAAPKPAYKIGDSVTHMHKPEWGIGKIDEIRETDELREFVNATKTSLISATGTQVYRVKYQKFTTAFMSDIWWSTADYLLPVKARFSIGDEVRYVFMPEWGIGKIVAMEVDHKDFEYVAPRQMERIEGLFYKVIFHGKGLTNIWWALDQNLIPAENAADEIEAQPAQSEA